MLVWTSRATDTTLSESRIAFSFFFFCCSGSCTHLDNKTMTMMRALRMEIMENVMVKAMMAWIMMMAKILSTSDGNSAGWRRR